MLLPHSTAASRGRARCEALPARGLPVARERLCGWCATNADHDTVAPGHGGSLSPPVLGQISRCAGDSQGIHHDLLEFLIWNSHIRSWRWCKMRCTRRSTLWRVCSSIGTRRPVQARIPFDAVLPANVASLGCVRHSTLGATGRHSSVLAPCSVPDSRAASLGAGHCKAGANGPGVLPAGCMDARYLPPDP
jgi:hypothetical protein